MNEWYNRWFASLLWCTSVQSKKLFWKLFGATERNTVHGAITIEWMSFKTMTESRFTWNGTTNAIYVRTSTELYDTLRTQHTHKCEHISQCSRFRLVADCAWGVIHMSWHTKCQIPAINHKDAYEIFQFS